MTKIVTVEEMRAIEAAAEKAGVSYAQMMDNAGRAIADRVKQILDEFQEPRVAVLVGPGKNGGDGLVAGRLIAEETGANVTFFLTAPRKDDDENLAKVRAKNLLVADAPTDSEQGYRVLRTMVGNADVILDALLGTGAKLPLRDDMVKVLRQVHKALEDRQNDHPQPTFITPSWVGTGSSGRQPIVIAIDLPTGLDADTGKQDPNILRADETITIEAAKPGLLAAPDAVGMLHIASLQLPAKLPARDDIKRQLVDAQVVRKLLPERPANSNKGTFGKALIVAGSTNYMGAPVLAAESAYRVGAGLVTVAAPQPIVSSIASHISETTYILLPHDMGVISEAASAVLRKEASKYTAVLLGPGIGQEEPTKEFIEAFLVSEKKAVRSQRRIGFAVAAAETATAEKEEPTEKLPPLVVDADALNLLAKMDEWWTRLPARTIVTPHPGEFARLAKIEAEGDGKATDIVQAKRIELATEQAAKWNCIVVLKGAYTVIADPDGRVAVLPFANAALATAGTGDVLAGTIVGYLAQGLDPFDAAITAGYVHGSAGDLAVDYVGSKASVLAGDVIVTLADAIGSLEDAS